MGVHAVAAAAAWWRFVGDQVPDVAAGNAPAGWRNVARPGGLSVRLQGRDAESLVADSSEVAVHRAQTLAGGWQWGLAPVLEALGEQSAQIQWLELTAAVGDDSGNTIRVTLTGANGVTRTASVTVTDVGDTTTLWVDDPQWHSSWQVPSEEESAGGSAAAAGPSAPVPGTVSAVLVAPGDAVVAGQTLVVIEAMKMEHRITADDDATVAEVRVAVGESVEAHQVVVTLATADGASDDAVTDAADATNPEERA